MVGQVGSTLKLRRPGGRTCPTSSSNIRPTSSPTLDAQALVDALHQAVTGQRVADVAAIRTRAERRETFRVADRNPENGFVHIVVRGCATDGRKRCVQKVGEVLLAAAETRACEPHSRRTRSPLTVEIHEIDPTDACAGTPSAKGRAGGMSTALDKALARADGYLARFRAGDGRASDRRQGGHRQRRDVRDASPVDNAVIAKVARGGAAEIDRAAKAAMKAFRTGWGHTSGEKRRAHPAQDRRRHRGARRRDRAGRMHGYRPADPLHVEGGVARRGELPLLRRPRAGRRRRPVAADRRRISTTRCASRSARSASSRRGTRRSCCRPGRSRRRSRPAARSCTSRPNGARSPRRCSPRSVSKQACRRACSTSCMASARTPARR